MYCPQLDKRYIQILVTHYCFSIKNTNTWLRKTRPSSAQPGNWTTKSATCWMVHWDRVSARCSATPGSSLACSSQQKGRSLGGGGGCGGGDDTPAGINTLWCMLRRRLSARSAAVMHNRENTNNNNASISIVQNKLSSVALMVVQTSMSLAWAPAGTGKGGHLPSWKCCKVLFIYALFWENVVSFWGLCPRLRPRLCLWTP